MILTESSMTPGSTVLASMFDGDIETIGVKTEFVGMAEDGTYLCRNLSGKILSWKYCKALLKFKGETK